MSIKRCVSLYSLQDEYMHKRMSLPDLFRFLDEQEIEGLELLPDQMMHGTPDPSRETLREWDRLVETHRVKPICSDVFLNTNLYNNRTLTKKECIELLKKEIRLANRMGIRLIRLVSMVPGFVIEPLLPYAEKYDVTFALEIHAGMSFGIPETKGFIDEMKRVDSPYCGLVVDAGIFCHRIPRVYDAYNSAVFGTTPEVQDFFHELFEKGLDGGHAFDENHNMVPQLKKIATDKDMPHIMLADGYENTPLSVLDDYWKYIKHFHFKLWEMVDGEEYSIDYRKLLQCLHDHQYDGYVATEYEGNRWTLPGKPTTEREQVLAHQEMLKRMIQEIEG